MRQMLEGGVRSVVGMRRRALAVPMVIGVSLAAVVGASPALAKEFKSKAGEWKPFVHCPLKHPAEEPFSGLRACVYAKSGAGSEFKAGNVTVHLAKAIVLQGGFIENLETEEQEFVGPEDGTPTVKPVAQAGPALTEDINPSLLPPAEKARYEKDVAAGKTKVTATVELAGLPTSINLNEENLLTGSGTALGLPVKVKLGNAFLGKSCYVGSDEAPIVINLTTGDEETTPADVTGELAGKVGEISSNPPGSILTIAEDSLVNNTYAAPGVEGCGKEAGAADAAINAGIGLPSATGNVAIINGTLKQAIPSEVEKADEEFGL